MTRAEVLVRGAAVNDSISCAFLLSVTVLPQRRRQQQSNGIASLARRRTVLGCVSFVCTDGKATSVLLACCGPINRCHSVSYSSQIQIHK